MDLLNAAYNFARANKSRALELIMSKRLPAWMRSAYYAGMTADVLPAQSRKHYSDAVSFYSLNSRECIAA